jgi:hypothetical protein
VVVVVVEQGLHLLLLLSRKVVEVVEVDVGMKVLSERMILGRQKI